MGTGPATQIGSPGPMFNHKFIPEIKTRGDLCTVAAVLPSDLFCVLFLNCPET